MDELCRAASAVTCPTLVVRGAQSDVVGPDEGRAFAELCPDARFVEIDGAGHTVQGDNPRALVGALRAFLAELDQPDQNSTTTSGVPSRRTVSTKRIM